MNQTGPTTPEGKARTSLNATKHGLTAMAMILPGIEDEDDWETFYQGVVDYYEPVGAVECAFVDRAAGLMWRLRRVSRAERDATLNARADDESLHPQLAAAMRLYQEMGEMFLPRDDDPPDMLDIALPPLETLLTDDRPEPQPRSLPEPVPLLAYSRYEGRLDAQLRHLHRELQRCKFLRERHKVLALNAL